MSAIRATLQQARSVKSGDLRKFGIVFACILAGVFYALIPSFTSGARPLLVLQISGALLLLAIAAPLLLRPLYLAAMVFGNVVGAVNNRIVLSLIFFVVFTPMALLMRLITKKDPMRSRIDPTAKSYRILRENKDLVKNKEKAF